MTTGHHQHTEMPRYGPTSTKIQTTQQTLLVQTQIPTQLTSNEVHQFTQLINHDSLEHVGGDTLVNDSDPGGSGNTVLLNDDDDDDNAQGEVESGSSFKGKAGHSQQDQRDADLHIKTKIGPCENGFHVERVKLIDESNAPQFPRDLLNSDATTEEDAENIGYLDADVESQPPHLNFTKDNKGVYLGKNTSEIVQPGVVNAQDNLTLQKTPESVLVTGTNGKKPSQSKRPSIASARAEALHASGLRAASRSASIGSAGKDDGNLLLDATADLTHGILNGELKKPLNAAEAELENITANKAADFDSVQSSPKAMVPFGGKGARSPCMSTSKSKLKGVSLGCASQQHALEQEHVNLDAKTGLNTNTVEGLPHIGSAILGVNVKVKSKQPSNQKARKLVFDFTDISPTTSIDRLEDGGGNADPEALETEHDYVLKKPVSANDAPEREQQPAGFHGTSANLSYLESQEPGEESQVHALNIIDKLAWLDTTCTSDDVVTSPVPQDGSVKGHTGAKGRQSLAQAAQMKTVHDKLDVFDWEDSQADEDEDVSPNTTQVPASMKARKRHLEAYGPISDRKKQVAHWQKTETTVHKYKTGDDSRMTPKLPTVEPCSSNQKVKAHILLTTRLRNIKTESEPSAKGRKSPGSKSEPRKHAGKEKQIVEPVKYLELGEQQGSDDVEEKVQQASFRVKNKLRNRAGKKKVVHESGKELESEQQKGIDKKGRKVRDVDSLCVKGKSSALKTSEVGPQIQGHLVLHDRTSQDDAVADIWIEAFTSAKNQTPASSSGEVTKFRKRSALHEDTGQSLKKCRTTEPGTVSFNEEHQNVNKKEEVPMKEIRVKLRPSIQQAPEAIKTSTISQNKGRRISTRFSRVKDQDIEEEEDKMEEQLTRKPKEKAKKSRIAEALMLSQLKGRRISTCNSQGEYQGASKSEEKPMEKDMAEGGLKTRQEPKQHRSADAETVLPIKVRGVGTRGSGAEQMEVENAEEDDMLERGPKTRSRAQDGKSIVPASDAKKGIRARNAAIKSSSPNTTADAMDEPSLSRGAMQADLDAEKPSIETKKKEISQHLTSKLTADAQETKADLCKVGSSGLSSQKIKRRGESSDPMVPDFKKTKENSGLQLKEQDKDNLLPKKKDLDRKKGGVSSTVLLRRTRSRFYDDVSQKDDFVSVGKHSHMGRAPGMPGRGTGAGAKGVPCFHKRGLKQGDRIRGRQGTKGTGMVSPKMGVPCDYVGKDDAEVQGDLPTDKGSLEKRIDFFDARKGLKRQVAKSATRTTKSISQRSKKTHAFEMQNSSNLVDEGRRRKREAGCIRVLFSHSLTEETIKHQKKILAKLGGQLAISVSDCTHFVSNGFARSQNMLISMAAGKEVVTTLWLESCGQAHYFVDEKTYITQDVKREKEFGFSMVTSLASARRKPLLKGVNVLVCPNTVPEPAVLKAVVQSAGGQAVDVKSWSSRLNEKEGNTNLIVVANEKDFDFCVQFLDKGLKVYSEELLLHGIVTQTLDYSRNCLFENFKQQKRPRRSTNINT